jgi:hypothetical protein
MPTTNQNWLANCFILFDQIIFEKTPYLGKGRLFFVISKKEICNSIAKALSPKTSPKNNDDIKLIHKVLLLGMKTPSLDGTRDNSCNKGPKFTT